MANATLDSSVPAGVRPQATTGRPWIIAILIVTLILPNYFYIGPLRLSPYKVVLILMFLPVMYKWLSGSAGGIKRHDTLMLFHCIWVVLALLAIYGVNRWEAAGLYLVETFTVFLLARTYIRTPADYRFLIACLCWSVVFLLPFALYEAQTTRRMFTEIMGALSPVNVDVPKDPRWGLDRVQGPFEHPILFGVYCSVAVAPAFYVWGRRAGLFGRTLRASAMVFGTFISLSVGAYISAVIQVFLMGYEGVTRRVKRRWLLLGLGFLVVYIVIDLLSNRTPVEVFITYLTFNSGNSYNRVLIWQYGTAEVWRHPFFGIGFEEWVRAHWMSTSMDNFWLVVAVRHGLPAFILLIWMILLCIFSVGARPFAKGSDMAAYRTAYLIGIGGSILALCTVHIWNANYVLMILIVGSGIWMLDHDGDGGEPTEDTSRGSRRPGRPTRHRQATPSRKPSAGGSRYTRGRPQKAARER